MAVTTPVVNLNDADWTLISSAPVHSMQVKHGDVYIIFAAAKPPAPTSPASQDPTIAMAHEMAHRDWLANNTTGSSWGLAQRSSTGIAAVTVAEG